MAGKIHINPDVDYGALYRKHGNVTAAARECMMDRMTFKRHLQYLGLYKKDSATPKTTIHNATGSDEEVTRQLGSVKDINDAKGTGTLTYTSKSKHTLEAAMQEAEIDTDVWMVERYLQNSWQVAMREPATTVGGRGDDAVIAGDEDGGGLRTLWTRGSHEPVKVTLYQTKLWLRRLVEPTQQDAVEAVCQRILKEGLPKPGKVRRSKVKNPHLLEMSLVDHHFGKLAWKRETLNDCDLAIARPIYENAVDDLLARVHGYDIERILIPLGNDFFHIDDDTKHTPTGKNELDVDGRLAKIYETGAEAFLRSVMKCREVAPVDILFVPGNHDPHTSYFLATMMRMVVKYSGMKDVTVNSEPISRKAYRYGTNLIGYAHKGSFQGGGKLGAKTLAVIMSTEWKKDWYETTWHEWHLADQHRAHGCAFTDVDEELGLRVRWLPSLCATDKWHYDNGYVLAKRVAEAYLWDKHEGYTGHFSVNMREG